MDEATALGLYQTMTRIRQFEKRAHDLFLQNLVRISIPFGPTTTSSSILAAERPSVAGQ